MFFLTHLLSFFKSPTMESLDLDPFDILFDPNIVLKSKLFLLLFTNWASMSPEPEQRISRFKVLKITHNKLSRPPEHEFLVIEILDNHMGQTKLFILDHTGSRQGLTTPDPSIDPAPSADPSADSSTDPVQSNIIVERLKKFVSAIAALFSARSESLLTSMEDSEGSSSQLSLGASMSDPLSIADKLSLYLTETADLVSDSLNISEELPAYDRFLGENFVRLPKWEGHIIQSLKPVNLSLFDLVILAHVTHETFPTYSYLKEQCYFFAALIFGTVWVQWGDESCMSSNQSGRYKGMKVKCVELLDISNVLSSYEKVRPLVLDKVNLFRSIKIPLTTAFNTDHATVACLSGPD